MGLCVFVVVFWVGFIDWRIGFVFGLVSCLWMGLCCCFWGLIFGFVWIDVVVALFGCGLLWLVCMVFVVRVSGGVL